MADAIMDRFEPGSSVLILCGSGNNGADGLALARLLHSTYRVTWHLAFGAGSSLAQLQRDRLEAMKTSSSPVERNNFV